MSLQKPSIISFRKTDSQMRRDFQDERCTEQNLEKKKPGQWWGMESY